MLPEPVTIRHPDRLFIDGAWVEPDHGGTLRPVSPDTEEVVCEIAEGGARDMDRAVAAARKAFDHGPWPRMAPERRADIVAAMARGLAGRGDELASAWTAQVGGLASIAPAVVAGGTRAFHDAAMLARTYPFVKVMAGDMVDTAIIAQEPVGVVAAIAPWNGPYVLMANKVANALVAGCAVIMKPAPETPLEAYIIAEEAERAGLPPGVLNLVCAEREASDHLVRNPDVDKVSFTGSTVAGQRIASVCGERIARCTLELGGKSAVILRDDFPLEDAAALLARTITIMSGQVCAMLSRAIVPRHRHDALADAIGRHMRSVVIGHSGDPATQLGPIALKRQLEKIETYVESGRETADLIAGGNRPGHLEQGYFLEPTLFANVDNRSAIAQEEIFGPVLCLIPCDDDEDAIRIANDSRFGLNGSVLTHDADAAYRIARALRTGTIGQNGMRMDVTMPFGGFKQSGIGREGGVHGLASFLETKTILLDACPPGLSR